MAFSFFGILAVLLETIRPWLPLIIAVLVIDLALTVWLWARGGRSWSSGRRPALFAGAVIGVAAFFLAPWLTSARFSDLSGLLDWMAVFGGSVGVAVLAAVLLWPLMTILFGANARARG
ncbi:MAG: hypothetical protein EA370_00720 [Wenzhouxiangella sp.]|nr:MAG: hypothetical protein EA370_00720 [Wenzhouxiangella sp.]